MLVSRGVLVGISALWVPLAFLFDGVTALVLPVRLADASGATELGLLTFAGILAGVALQPIAGALSDRLRPRVERRVFLTAAAVPALVGIWLLVGTTGTVAAVAGFVLLQAAAGTVHGVQGALIPEHVPPSARGRASGYKSAFDIGGAFVGFVVLGAVLAGGGLRDVGVVLTIALVTGIAALWLLVPRTDPQTRTDRRPPAARFGDVPRGLLPLLLSRFLFLFGTYAVGRFLLLLVAERSGVPAARAADEAGAYLALFALATALAAFPFGWLTDRRGARDVMAVGAVLSGLGIAGFIPTGGAAGVIVAGMLMALGTAAFVSANWAAATQLVRPADAGRVMGIVGVATGLAAATAGLLGPVIDRVGFGPALGLAALVAFAALIPLADVRSSYAPLLEDVR